jgi:hypothetical protein
MRRTIHTALAVTAAVSLAAPPAALARPARDTPAPVVGLTPAQLRAIDGHQPLDPPASSPVEITPLSAPATGGEGPDAWLLVAVPLTVIGAAGAARKITHRSLLPHRRARVSV